MSDTRDRLVVVIMAGGSGTRFWPLSTSRRPKQFLTLFGERSMLQHTWDRISDLVPPERCLVLTGRKYVSLAAEQLPMLPEGNIIGEPLPRDTAGAVGLAAAICRSRHPGSVMAVLTADHFIQPTDIFQQTLLSAAEEAASADCLYTFGISPTHPATGYGYLERGVSTGIEGHYKLKRFVEKPDIIRARRFLSNGNFYWNSGMFVWKTDTIWSELHKHLPAHVETLAPLSKVDSWQHFQEVLEACFFKLEGISIDFGVMEKAADVRVVSGMFEWSDVGSWPALENTFYTKGGDEEGSENRGRGRLFSQQAENNFVFCEDENETVALVGVRDLMVIRSGDRTLIAPRDQAEAIKDLVKELNDED